MDWILCLERDIGTGGAIKCLDILMEGMVDYW